MSTAPINNHLDLALLNLLQQYKEKPKIKALVTAIITPVQDAEDMFQELYVLRNIDLSVGIQLDRLGIIVGQPREGLADDPYRIRIKIRILQNISQGEPDTLIAVYQSLTNDNKVYYQENYPAGLQLWSEGDIPAGQETVTWENIQDIAAAGVRVDSINTIASDKPFYFAGGQYIGGGFGDANDPTVGGAMATKRIPVGLKFAFAGGSPDNLGFGDQRDPVMGGHLIGAT